MVAGLCPAVPGSETRGHTGAAKSGQVFPEKFAAVQDFSAAHVEQVHGQHLIFVVISEDVGVVAFDGGDALLLLQLLDG